VSVASEVPASQNGISYAVIRRQAVIHIMGYHLLVLASLLLAAPSDPIQPHFLEQLLSDTSTQ
jgi:hypothetical protein